MKSFRNQNNKKVHKNDIRFTKRDSISKSLFNVILIITRKKKKENAHTNNHTITLFSLRLLNELQMLTFQQQHQKQNQ
jgi:hypothetical protein